MKKIHFIDWNWHKENSSVAFGEIHYFDYPLRFINRINEGTQWLSVRVLDSRPKGRGFEPHRRHCIVVLEQDTFILA